jgi:DNA-binding CsgD family transcriptional regulator
VSGDPRTIIGRVAELSVIDEFLDALDSVPTVLLLEGEVGIGKTTLWKEGLSAATGRDLRVLECRPIHSEAHLAYAALGDLLDGVPEAALTELPEPQRHALEVALMRAEPHGQQSFPRAVALGLLGVLRVLARDRPVVVGIDDGQWLDQPSDSVLSFVARRLKDERIGFLIARRLDGPPGFRLDLARELPEGRLRRLQIEPLEIAQVDRLLRTRLSAQVPRRSLARLHRTSGGNAFFALEIGRALLESGDPGTPADDLPIPASLRDLVHDRLSLLPRPALEAAQVAAASSRPTVALIGAAMGERDAAAAVAAGVQAGVVELDGDRVRFAHPLLASVAYMQMSPAQKRDVHRRVAASLDDPEERGRHLALATQHPDAEIATALDDAARRARARGAPGAAAELWEQARRLTPAGAGREAQRRGVEAAERHFEAGDVERARALLEETAAQASPGRDRAQALARLGWVCAHTDGFRAGADVFRAALAQHADDVAVRIEIEEGLAWCIHSTSGVPEAEAHARTALELAEALGEPTLLAGALSHLAFLESLAGRGIAIERSRRAMALGHSPAWSQILGRPDWIQALLLQWAGNLGASRERFEALYREAVDRGDEHSLPFVLFHLARVELMTGDWERARRHAGECQETTMQSGQVGERPYAFAIEALVEAHLGLVEPARAKIDEGLVLAQELGAQPAGLELLAVRGFLELSLGDHARAEHTLGAVAEAADRAGLREPALFRFHGDAIESQVALGHRDEAREQLDDLERLGAALGRTWVLTIACRCRGLLSAAIGDLDAAYRALERGLGLHDELGEPFERARTLLVLGTVQRRDRKKRAARDSLRGALETFEQLGATLWSAKARAELARIGGRAPAAGLTPTEERVAELIASGRTYREAADGLFISPKTVQWNLSKIYRKLGIRSRAELPARLAEEQRARARQDDSSPGEPLVPRSAPEH